MVAGRLGATLVVASEDDEHLAQLLRLLPPAPSSGAGPCHRRASVRSLDRGCKGDACLTVALVMFSYELHCAPDCTLVLSVWM